MLMSEDNTLVELYNLIHDYKNKQPDVVGQIVMAYPAGIPIANTWEGEVDPILIGAISAAVKLTFQHLCDNLKKGNLRRVYMNSEYGKVIIQNAGFKAILTTIMNSDADIYSIGFTQADLAGKIEQLLKKWEPT
jgi:predicted regulator of Ras-like GTPase activity (Roadblock/LC7/MglB family)